MYLQFTRVKNVYGIFLFNLFKLNALVGVFQFINRVFFFKTPTYLLISAEFFSLERTWS